MSIFFFSLLHAESTKAFHVCVYIFSSSLLWIRILHGLLLLSSLRRCVYRFFFHFNCCCFDRTDRYAVLFLSCFFFFSNFFSRFDSHTHSLHLSLSLSLSTLPFYSVAIHFTSTILLLFRCMPSGDFFSSSKKVNEILFHSTFDHCQPIRLGRCYCNLLFN